MAAVDGVDQIVLNLHRNLFLRSLYFFDAYLNSLSLNSFKFVIKCLLPVSNNLFQNGDVFFWQRQHSFSLERYGIAHVAALPAG